LLAGLIRGFFVPREARPLQFKEFEERVGQQIYVSATPSEYEREASEQIVEQIIRPTGLIDPEIVVKPVLPKDKFKGQVEDFIEETVKEVKKCGRVLVTTLTKKMAEDLATYLRDRKVKAEYIHSDVKTMDRIQILTKFRKGDFDCLVGVNLLREGLDLPEVSLIGILDADKEGFLRSETSLIQTIGRAARNVGGRVILYADSETGSMERAISETNRRRKIQEAYNKEHGITPKTILKSIKDITDGIESLQKKTVLSLISNDIRITGQKAAKLIKQKEREMKEAAKNLDFETAAILRDELKELQKIVDGKVDKKDK
jgi:excinuclease ABC subunit B